MNTCASCEAELPDGAKYCPKCGEPTDATEAAATCPECEAKVPEGSKFCPECGAKVKGSEDGDKPDPADKPAGAFTVPKDPEEAAKLATDPRFKEAVARAIMAAPTFAAEVATVGEKFRTAEVTGDLVEITEASVRTDGTAKVCVITPGWGSSGYYSEEVLKRDAPKVFPAGTKMYWNHQTAAEERERPEGDLTNLAAVTTTPARWQDAGPDGPAGVYAETKVFNPFRDALAEIAPHIGVSIRAGANMRTGEAEGRKGRIVEQLVAGKSVDFVTDAGRGGKVVDVFESLRGKVPTDMQEGSTVETITEAKHQEVLNQLKEAQDAAARANEALRASAAKSKARELIADAKLPEATKARVIESVSANAPAAEDGTLDEGKLEEAVKAAAKIEADYLARATGSGTVSGLGGGDDHQELAEGDVPDEKLGEAIEEAFKEFGLSEDAAKVAAAGR